MHISSSYKYTDRRKRGNSGISYGSWCVVSGRSLSNAIRILGSLGVGSLVLYIPLIGVVCGAPDSRELTLSRGFPVKLIRLFQFFGVGQLGCVRLSGWIDS